MPVQSRLSSRSTGQFNPQEWLKEGDGLMASSQKIRSIWEDHRENFLRAIRHKKERTGSRIEDWNLLTGLPRSSMLLLGYAVEMYLKAGLAKAYRGCGNKMFDRDVKSRFRHNLCKIAKELGFPFQPADRQNFNKLKDMVLVDARYPVLVPEGCSYPDAVNQQTSRIWSESEYTNLCSLGQQVREHVARIDSDPSNPASFININIDDDGYLAFRVGGHLPPRITYRISTLMREAGQTDIADVKAFLTELPSLLRYWDSAYILEDGKDCHGKPKTLIRRE